MRRTLVLLSCAAAAVGLSVAVPAAASAAGTASLPNSHPSWATPGNKVAATTADSRIGFSVYLKMRDQAGAEALATAVSDPNSSCAFASFRTRVTSDARSTVARQLACASLSAFVDGSGAASS